MHKQISTRGEMKPFASRNQSVKQLSQIVSHITTEGYFQGFSLMVSTVFCRPVHSPQSTVHSPQSTVHSPQSTVHSPHHTDEDSRVPPFIPVSCFTNTHTNNLPIMNIHWVEMTTYIDLRRHVRVIENL